MPDRTPLHDATARAGAVFTEDAGWLVPDHYGDAAAEYAAARDGAAVFDLSHRGKLEVSDKEAARFLHNLCTNDVVGLPAGAGHEAFFATPTARAVSHALIYRLQWLGRPEAYWLDLVPGLAARTLKHVSRYRISDQVEFADRTVEFAQLHVAGPRSRAVVETALGNRLPDLPELGHVMVNVGGVACNVRRHDPLAATGYDLIVPREAAEGLWQRLLEAGARPAGLRAYDVLRVEGGTPVYGVDVEEDRFVAEVGRTRQAISYAKGCYLGQEPIVMARDRGQVNRTLLGLKLAGSEPAARGAKVLHAGAEIGQVTSSVVSPRLGPIALAYLRRGHQDPGIAVEVVDDASRRSAEVVGLPFSGVGVGAGSP
jgi:tRNA-modifying protein YgfZ